MERKMINNFKKKYQVPQIRLLYIKMEEGIASTSQTPLSGGDDSNKYQPVLKDWTENTMLSDKFDI